ncbi:MAG: cytochrome c nitrite reductase small subunit [Verrucomicrobia subdivision 3 bacterium]|nr:cytochrome c nitrite reductase small subunit [Limisphaerales bacterium]
MNTKGPDGSVKPPNKVTVLLGVVMALAVGVAVGIGGYTFSYAKGASYLSNDPKACANCHIMQDHLDGWIKSSHRAVATCNDCHTPPGFVPKYFTKADHGFFHSLAFTTDKFHEPIQMKERSRGVTEGACRKCHQDIVHDIEATRTSSATVSCIRCHASVGHPK